MAREGGLSSHWVLCGVVVTEHEPTDWSSSVRAEVMETPAMGKRRERVM